MYKIKNSMSQIYEHWVAECSVVKSVNTTVEADKWYCDSSTTMYKRFTALNISALKNISLGKWDVSMLANGQRTLKIKVHLNNTELKMFLCSWSKGFNCFSWKLLYKKVFKQDFDKSVRL